jgi:pseudolysin
MKYSFFFILQLASFLLMQPALAATPIELEHRSIQSTAIISAALPNKLRANNLSAPPNSTKMEKVQLDKDFNKTTHIRMRQTYTNLPVWGAEAIIHIPHSTLTDVKMNNQTTLSGIIYEGIEKDLSSAPTPRLNDSQKNEALKDYELQYRWKSKSATVAFQNESSKTIIYVTRQQRATYAFLVSFYFDDGKSGAHHPAAIIDASTREIYQEWDYINNLDSVMAGGIGGNEKTGQFSYDGNLSLPNHFSALAITRDNDSGTCYLENDEVSIRDVQYENTAQFTCEAADRQRNNLYFPTNEDADTVYNGYSPNNDALYAASTVKRMYQEWFNFKFLDENKLPVKFLIKTHYGRNFEGAFANSDNYEITFGDGGKDYYPLPSLGVTAHEMSHIFTAKHSKLFPFFYPGALNESYSDMASQAAEFFATGKNNWRVGDSVMKGNRAKRYMDDPKKDGVSIDNAKDYDPEKVADPHIGAGVFNKAFYLLATSKNWDTKKAFAVMVQANMHYWTTGTNFNQAACGVISATKDFNYETSAVKSAFDKVGISTDKC